MRVAQPDLQCIMHAAWSQIPKQDFSSRSGSVACMQARQDNSPEGQHGWHIERCAQRRGSRTIRQPIHLQAVLPEP